MIEDFENFEEADTSPHGEVPEEDTGVHQIVALLLDKFSMVIDRAKILEDFNNEDICALCSKFNQLICDPDFFSYIRNSGHEEGESVEDYNLMRSVLVSVKRLKKIVLVTNFVEEYCDKDPIDTEQARLVLTAYFGKDLLSDIPELALSDARITFNGSKDCILVEIKRASFHAVKYVIVLKDDRIAVSKGTRESEDVVPESASNSGIFRALSRLFGS